jgi:predicted acyl esterase
MEWDGMSKRSDRKISRRDILRTVVGAAAVGAAGLAIPSATAQQSSSNEKIDVIIAKTRPITDPACHDPGLAPGVRVQDGMRIERDVAVKMRDGVTIYVDIYRPDGANTNLPAIVSYASGKEPQDRERRGVPHHGGSEWGLYDVSKYAMGEGPDPVYWCKYGYAIVNTDYRGARHSGGIGQLYGTQGGRDVHDLVEWLAAQDWSNGKIGMAGNSQLATWQWVGAAEEPPHLAAIAPWEGWTDLYRQIVCPGGIPEVGVRSGAIKNWCGGDGVEDVIAMIHKYPFMNSYWEDKIARLDRIKVPAYITANFKHWHLLGSLNAFRQIPVRDKWLRFINNQEWPDFYALPQMDDLRSFFDHYLKGIDNEWLTTPRVRLCVLDPGGLDQINRPEKEWPLARTRYERLYLDASDGTLSSQPIQKESQARYASQTGQANFVVKFDRDTELTGYFKLRLWVEAADANDMDLFIYVQKLDHKGNFLPSLILGHPHPGAQGWLRVSHRELDPNRSTPSEPFLTHRHQQLIRPKEIVPVEIPIWPTGMLWHAGQQLRVVVSGHYIDTRGPDWWEKFKFDAQNHGDHIIHTGGKYDSHLLVPIIRA